MKEVYARGICHNFGMAMAIFIFFSDNYDDIRLSVHNDSNYESFMNNMIEFDEKKWEEYTERNNIKFLELDELPSLIGKYVEGEFQIHIHFWKSELKHALNTLLVKLSHMNSFQFLDKYEHSMKKLKLTPLILLSAENIKKINENYKKTVKKLTT